MRAKVAYIYGWSDMNISNMDFQSFYKYYLCIPALEAQNLMLNLNLADYPHLTKTQRQKLFNTLKRQSTAVIEKPNDKKLVSFDKMFGGKNG